MARDCVTTGRSGKSLVRMQTISGSPADADGWTSALHAGEKGEDSSIEALHFLDEEAVTTGNDLETGVGDQRGEPPREGRRRQDVVAPHQDERRDVELGQLAQPRPVP